MKTNAELKLDVAEALLWDPTVTSNDINISADNGVITLSGTVPHYAEKKSAEAATRRVDGVKAIAESMEVHFVPDGDRTDSDIAQAAVSTLRWHVWVPSDVQATVANGWVTLTGSVQWGYQRTSAENAVSSLIGVKGLTNKIVMRPSVQPAEVQSLIEKALTRNASLDASHISVSANGSHVKLAGSVRSWDERDEAGTAAWNAPGVTEVENALSVTY